MTSTRRFVHMCTTDVDPYNHDFAEGVVDALCKALRKHRTSIPWLRWGVDVANGYRLPSILYHGPTWTTMDWSTVDHEDLCEMIVWATVKAKSEARRSGVDLMAVYVWCEEV